MRKKSWHGFGLIALAVAPLCAQSSQPVYWSAEAPNCTSLGQEAPVSIVDASGNILGYSCFVTGTFAWLAAGGIWGTTIRVAAPSSGAVGLDYTFYSTAGITQNLDATLDRDPRSLRSGNELAFSLFANQPSEVELLGATNDTPSYGATAEGSIYVAFFCPDAVTCSHVQPQLLYSALPAYPWSLSVPIAWDTELSSQWSAVAIDDGITNVVGLVIYNEDNSSANTYTIYVYDANGDPPVSGTTPSVPPSQAATGQGGTYSALLDDLVSNIPAGPIKILIDGGSLLSAVEVLQINGTSATTLQVAFDTAPGSAAAVKNRSTVRRSHVRTHKIAEHSLRK